MASLFTEGFEGGASGAAITTSNSAFNDNVTGAPVFSNAQFVTGAQSGRVTVSAQTKFMQHDNATARSTAGYRFYFRFATAVPAATSYFFTVLDATPTIRARIGMNTDGTVRIQNGSTLVNTTTAALSPDAWYRFEWVLDNGATTQQLKIFDLHNTSAISGADISGLYNTGSHQKTRLGFAISSTWDVFFDAVAADDTATFLGPAVIASNWTYGYDVVIGG